MSWLFGLLARHVDSAERERLGQIHPSPIHRVDKPTLYLAAGGLPETCLAGTLAGYQKEDGWLLVGLPILRDATSIRFASASDLSDRLSDGRQELDDLDGHYVVAQWSPTNLTCRADPHGLRTLYASQRENGTYVSTRLDWLAQAVGGLDIDFSSFGSHWLAANQYSHRSLVHDVTRLTPGGVMTCSFKDISTTTNPWAPGVSHESPEDRFDIATDLRPYLNPELQDDTTLSLGLSGGLDSRVLLAILIQSGAKFGVHIFGDAKHPDVQVATNIAQQEQLQYERLRARLPATHKIIDELSEYAAATNVSAPASASSKLGAYPELREKGRVCIDGFFGEIARRRYYNRLLRQRKHVFESAEGLFPHVHVPRPRLFNEQAMNLMRAGMIADLDEIVSWHSSSDSFRKENFVDLLAIRFRLPNFSGYEQARLDGLALTYMPFVQRPFLQSVLSRPVRDRRGARLFRRSIKRHYPPLSKYPLVKGGTTYPYVFTTVPALLWTTAKTRLGLAYEEGMRVDFLLSIEEFVRDLVRSAPVKSYNAYEYSAIVNTVESFYQGEHSLAGYVDWWLAFEAWRGALSC